MASGLFCLIPNRSRTILSLFSALFSIVFFSASSFMYEKKSTCNVLAVSFGAAGRKI